MLRRPETVNDVVFPVCLRGFLGFLTSVTAPLTVSLHEQAPAGVRAPTGALSHPPDTDSKVDLMVTLWGAVVIAALILLILLVR